MSGAVIGKNCNLGQNVVVGSKVVLGNNVRVQNNVSVYEGVICEDDVFLGPGMVLTNVINPRSAVSRKHEFRQTLIRKGATIGANATIVCGNEIGEYAFIGAGAVVTKPVAPYALIIGNPGRQSGWMSEYGHKLQFDAQQRAVCPESKQEYILANGTVKKIK
jgi:UDP-2-acetamido-3-amino-2,3-dideoxy-glucuronate N-acetyltransferase